MENNKKDSFGVISISGWRKKRYQKMDNGGNLNSEKLLQAIKERNQQVRRLIKIFGLFVILPIFILSIIYSSPHNIIMTFIFWLSFLSGAILWLAYENYKKSGYKTCKNCLKEFVPENGDPDEGCPFCGNGNSVAYL